MTSAKFFMLTGAVLLSIVGNGWAQYGKPVEGIFIPLNGTHNRNSSPPSYGFRVPQPNPYPAVPPSLPYPPVANYPVVNNPPPYPVVNNPHPAVNYPAVNYPAVTSYPNAATYVRTLPNNRSNYSMGSDKTLTIGQRKPGDKKVLQSIITKKQKWFRSSDVTKEIDFPDKSSKMRVTEITSIVVKDNTKDGSGGHTKIVKGGTGSPSVRLLFESVPDKNIDLTLIIYAFGG